MYSRSTGIPGQLFPVLLILACRSARQIALNFSSAQGPATLFNPRLLVTARALNFFGQELCPARLSFFLVAPPTFLSPSLMDTKASGRKREESSYRSRVREWKREGRERRARWGERSADKERRRKRQREREKVAETQTWKFKFDGVRLFSPRTSKVRVLLPSSGTCRRAPASPSPSPPSLMITSCREFCWWLIR